MTKDLQGESIRCTMREEIATTNSETLTLVEENCAELQKTRDEQSAAV